MGKFRSKLLSTIAVCALSYLNSPSLALAVTKGSPTFDTIYGNLGTPNAAAKNGAVPHVSDLAALRAFDPTASQVVDRDHFAVNDNSPSLHYVWKAICPGTPDNLARYVAPTASGSGCWDASNDLKVGNLLEWGAPCDTKVMKGSIEVTSPTAPFTYRTVITNEIFSAADIGKIVQISAGGPSTTINGVNTTQAFQGTITAVVNSDGAHISTLTVATTTVGTDISSFTPASIYWGHDSSVAVNAAIASLQGVIPIAIPALCGVVSGVQLTASGAKMYGLLPVQSRHDNTPSPYIPAPTSGFAWLGANNSILFNQRSPNNVNFTTKNQHVWDLSFYGGNSASIARNLGTAADGMAENLYAEAAVQANFAYGFNGSHTVTETAGTCNHIESNFVSDATSNFATAYFLSGDTTIVTDFCNSELHDFVALFSAGDALDLVFTDHNLLTNFEAIANGSATTGYSVVFTGVDSTHYAQGNGIERIGVGNFPNPTLAHIVVEPLALGNWIKGMDPYDPPVGWTVDNFSTSFTCMTELETPCASTNLTWARFGTPTSSSMTCTVGQTMFDANYFYNCVATNTWRRTTTTTF